MPSIIKLKLIKKPLLKIKSKKIKRQNNNKKKITIKKKILLIMRNLIYKIKI